MLEAGLTNDDQATRWYAFSAITYLNRPEIADIILRGLENDYHGIRYTAVSAARSLAEHPDLRDRCVEGLKKILRKERENWNTSISAAWALADLGLPVPGRIFAEALKKDRLDHRLCARALGILKCREAMQLLIDRFECADTWNSHEFNEALKAITGQKLGRHPGPWREWLESNRAYLPVQWT